MSMPQQNTDTVFVIRPANFAYNPETADSNTFQQRAAFPDSNLQYQVQVEFAQFIKLLRDAQIRVVEIEDTSEPSKPDAVFPNNWISFHSPRRAILYPMMAKSRRLERRKEILDLLEQELSLSLEEVSDWSYFEQQDLFLEGTGSLVLDRTHSLAYAALSPRTHPEVFQQFSQQMGYQVVSFTATDTQQVPIYHTNVMMSVGEKFAVVCLAVIPDVKERAMVVESLQRTGHQIIEITIAQMNCFAGNVLQLQNTVGEKQIVISQQALASLKKNQRQALAHHGNILAADIPTIEKGGGGSVRCMIAEIFT